LLILFLRYSGESAKIDSFLLIFGYVALGEQTNPVQFIAGIDVEYQALLSHEDLEFFLGPIHQVPPEDIDSGRTRGNTADAARV
jgi:hypothetical protein